MTTNVMVLGFGAMLLLVGIVGGGFEIKEFKIPKVSTFSRMLAAVAGSIFILLGIGLGNTEARPNQSVSAETDIHAAQASMSNPPAQPIEFTIYNQLGEGEVTEQVTVLIDGKIKGQLTVDRGNPQSMLAVTVPGSGRYSYTIESRSVVEEQGNLYEFPGAGQGMITVESGKRFDLVATPSGNTWLVTLRDGPGIDALNQN
jgi:hypothetical protein